MMTCSNLAASLQLLSAVIYNFIKKNNKKDLVTVGLLSSNAIKMQNYVEQVLKRIVHPKILFTFFYFMTFLSSVERKSRYLEKVFNFVQKNPKKDEPYNKIIFRYIFKYF